MTQTTDKFIPQFVPYWDGAERKAVQHVLDGDYLNEHKQTREFERKFAEFVKARYCVTCTSGTIALYLALLAVPKPTSRILIVPDYAGIFAANAAVQARLKPVLQDVETNGSIGLINGGGVVVHSNGRPGTWEDGIDTVVEDCAQAISTHTPGAVSCYSFASTKHLTSAGQGGAICCDDPEIFDTLTRLKDHGRNDRQQLKPMSDHFARWGTNFKFTEIAAAFGLAQLAKLPTRLSRLEAMYKLVVDELRSTPAVAFFDEPPSWYIDLRLRMPHLHPENVIAHLGKYGIGARRFYKPLHQQPLFKSNKPYPHTQWLYSVGIWLPSTTNLDDETLKYICIAVKDSVK